MRKIRATYIAVAALLASTTSRRSNRSHTGINSWVEKSFHEPCCIRHIPFNHWLITRLMPRVNELDIPGVLLSLSGSRRAWKEIISKIRFGFFVVPACAHRVLKIESLSAIYVTFKAVRDIRHHNCCWGGDLGNNSRNLQTHKG